MFPGQSSEAQICEPVPEKLFGISLLFGSTRDSRKQDELIKAVATFVNLFCVRGTDEKCNSIAINIRAIFQKCVSATYPIPFGQIKERKSDSLFSNNNSEGQKSSLLYETGSAKSFLLPFRYTPKLYQHSHISALSSIWNDRVYIY